VDGILLIAVVGLGIALAAAMYALRRRADDGASLHEQLVRAREEATEARASLDAARSQPPVDPVVELLSVGVIHLGPDRRIDRANERAHVLLDVRPGRLVGRTVMEALLDARAESLIDGVTPGSSATGVPRLSARPRP